MNIPYTICFIVQGTKILMLFRNRQPNQYKWNGVGGKIERGEDPKQSCLREIWEETGFKVRDLTFRGIVSWNYQNGMYVYTARDFYGQMVSSDEGKLEWKELEWVKSSPDVVSNIAYFIDEVLSNHEPLEHVCLYDENNQLSSYEAKTLALV